MLMMNRLYTVQYSAKHVERIAYLVQSEEIGCSWCDYLSITEYSAEVGPSQYTVPDLFLLFEFIILFLPDIV